ncbi:MAG: hypothetical protein DDT20_00612 [Firmicutes bacterium]|nr:hypothetical protein [Bacillota bacterium]
MPNLVGIRFKSGGKVYHFDAGAIPLVPGEFCVVETVRGQEYGEVVSLPRDAGVEGCRTELRPVLRKATPEDEQRVASNQRFKQEAFAVALEKIALHQLPMKLIDVEIAFDGAKILFFFTADGRVDFRALVKDLAYVFRTRIELRQIGVRDEAKMIGGLGSCGRVLCCNSFLGDFAPVSIKMAKEQHLSLNPAKISGLCGRLMCCLRYESNFPEVLAALSTDNRCKCEACHRNCEGERSSEQT